MSNRQPAVVVTGASTGIGENAALHLSKLGYRVFAGVRQAADGDRLREASGGRVHPITLDVTDTAMIAAAREEVESHLADAQLVGLVNNAGIAVGGPLEFVPLAELRQQLEVNVIGQVAVTQAFLPLIRKAKGRIAIVGSISGRLTPSFFGPYCASKYALEAITTALRKELRYFGIHVAMIEPGVIRTPIWQKGAAFADRLFAAVPPEGHTLYGKILTSMRDGVGSLGDQGLPPEAVSNAIVHALSAARPKRRYIIGKEARIGEWVRLLPEALQELLVR